MRTHGNPAQWGFDMFFSLAMYLEGAFYAGYNNGGTCTEFCGGFLPGMYSRRFRNR